MITVTPYFPTTADNAPIPLPGVTHQVLLQILAAAMINRGFRDCLLQEPLTAIQQGPHGQKFWLSAHELDILLAIRADTIEDFAAQLESLRDRSDRTRANRRVNGRHKSSSLVSEATPAMTVVD